MTTALVATSSTLQQQITAIADKLRPCGEEGAAKAIRTLRTGGMGLPSTIKAEDVNKVYSYALSGLSSEALTIACKKLVRGEYDIERKSFIPLPPELAAMVRAEQRLISDDLARARATLDSLKPAPVEQRSPEAQARVRALRLDYLNRHQEHKERNGLAPVADEFNDEKAAYFERIMSLKDAPFVSAEQVAERQKRSMQIANSNFSTNPPIKEAAES